MISKEELTEILKAVMKFEEEMTPVIFEKSLSCLREIRRESSMTEEDQKRMRDLLFRLVDEAKGHENVIKDLIRRVETSPDREY
ncbi:MAG: hypothetical protein Q8R76_07330 [Candidatus Omnitrophota bacterium]|nr:hypothetical protein [Candidatus Omnitrophota bacterium]